MNRNGQTIALLEHALDKARRGEIEDIVIAGMSSSGVVINLWSPTLDYITRLGLIEDLKLTWYQHSGTDDGDEA